MQEPLRLGGYAKMSLQALSAARHGKARIFQ